jgi:hypothetical protein
VARAISTALSAAVSISETGDCLLPRRLDLLAALHHFGTVRHDAGAGGGDPAVGGIRKRRGGSWVMTALEGLQSRLNGLGSSPSEQAWRARSRHRLDPVLTSNIPAARPAEKWGMRICVLKIDCLHYII